MNELLIRLTGRLTFNAPFVWFSIASLLMVTTAFFWPRCAFFRWFPVIQRWLTRLGSRPALTIVIVGLVSLGVNLVMAAIAGIPVPRVYDEFSYLLAADTFAHGRLANPSSSFWEHFEALYEIQQPTYASKYPPGLGLFLAGGQFLAGHPIVGAWVGTSLACGAVCWMLLAWLPKRWAVLGGLGIALHPQVILWAHGYWGGEVAMLGGALVLGGVGRFIRHANASAGIWLAVGLGILAISRPFEGLVLGALGMLFLLVQIIRRQIVIPWQSAGRIFVPAALVLFVTGTWVGYYNWRVTGNPLRLPYLVHEETYAAHPLFLWLPPKQAPVYRHPDLEADYRTDVGLETYRRQTASLGGLMMGFVEKLTTLGWAAFPVWIILIPFFCVIKAARGRPMVRWALWSVGILLFAILSETVVNRHYAAPAAGLMTFLTVMGMRSMAVWERDEHRKGQALVGAILLVYVAALPVTGLQVWRANRANKTALHRAALVSQLQQMGGRHLVLVGSPQNIWIFNSADRNAGPVLWARDMGAERNRALIAHHADRRVWWLDQEGGSENARLRTFVPGDDVPRNK